MRRERRDLTDAVGLQRAELEPGVAAAGVARLHRDALPVAADGRGGGALVDDGCGGKRGEVAPSFPEPLTRPLRNVGDCKILQSHGVPQPHVPFQGNPSWIFFIFIFFLLVGSWMGRFYGAAEF